MSSPADITAQTYQQQFAKYVERTPPALPAEFMTWIDAFLEKLPPSGALFELGSAFGRDARYFASKGFDPLCTDIVPEALHALAQEGFKTKLYDFRDAPAAEWIGAFDGFFANAVLLHASPEHFTSTLQNAAQMLKPNGFLALSLKTGEGEEMESKKLESPRYFRYYTEPNFRSHLDDLPFHILEVSFALEETWLLVILQKRDNH